MERHKNSDLSLHHINIRYAVICREGKLHSFRNVYSPKHNGGDVTTGDGSFWLTRVRGDVNFIRMGNKVNVQDGACIHCTYQRAGTTIGNNVSIGHHAIVHGCTVHDNVLIGMGAIIMDNAVVHSNSIIAAGAVVLENTICEPGSIYAGVPAKKVKTFPKK